MLLNPYLYKDSEENKFVSDESIKKANIVYRKRKIYILKKYASQCFEAGSIFNSYIMNNVILVNISRSKNSDGTFRSIKSIYSFSYTGIKGEKIPEFLNSRLRLNYCITSGYDSAETYKEGNYEDSEFYNDLGFTFGYDENEDPVEVNINDLDCDIESSDYVNSEKLKIPDPNYYTIKQYEIDKKCNYDFIMHYDRYYNARDLIDDVTDIYLVDENEKNKLNKTSCEDSNGQLLPMNNGDTIFETWEKIRDAEELPLDMFILNSQSCFNSYKFIYDSKYGFNIKDINTDKSIIKSRNSDYIEMIAEHMKKYCDKLSKIYGDLRIHYYSSDISDSIEIIFDDTKYHKIVSTFDKNSMFERLMVFITDKYEPVLNRYSRNNIIEDNLNFLSLV